MLECIAMLAEQHYVGGRLLRREALQQAYK